jgi:Zn-dependent metalloprotease
VPFIFGVVAYQSFMTEETRSSGRVPLPARGENVIGGHAMLAVGYDDGEQAFIARNSWGTEWGLEGHCLVPYPFLLGRNTAGGDFWALHPPEGVETAEEPVDEAAGPEVFRETPEAEVAQTSEGEAEPAAEDAEARRARLGTARWAVYDARGQRSVPGRLVRRQGDPPVRDAAVNEAADGVAAVDALLREAFGRNSYDDQGAPIEAVVHYGKDYDNAHWDGHFMVFGDGDGRLFNRFTIAPEMFGHSLGHAIIEHTAHLATEGQPGALAESFCDVFGTLARQWTLRQTAEQADWLIGVGLLGADVKGVALRSMRAPGTAYDDTQLGRDRQPAHMRDYEVTTEDRGGAHTNCGIPNHAFYLAATAIGGYAWERAGLIWYLALRDKLKAESDFAQAAMATIEVASERFGSPSAERQAVEAAWIGVGVLGDDLPPPNVAPA